jgi:type IV pilus assembly protein PilX
MIVLHLSRSRATPPKQQGVVLFIALIVLVVMSLVGISMIRQGSSSQMIVGNLAFKEGAEAAADFGVEHARAWLTSKSGDQLQGLNPDPKPLEPDPISVSHLGWEFIYVADGLTGSFDPFSTTTWKSPEQVDSLGQRVTFIVHRLCEKTGSVTAENNLCILYSETSSKEGIDYGNAPVAGFMPYYRVTVRVTGPRNTTSYVQALLY